MENRTCLICKNNFKYSEFLKCVNCPNEVHIACHGLSGPLKFECSKCQFPEAKCCLCCRSDLQLFQRGKYFVHNTCLGISKRISFVAGTHYRLANCKVQNFINSTKCFHCLLVGGELRKVKETKEKYIHVRCAVEQNWVVAYAQGLELNHEAINLVKNWKKQKIKKEELKKEVVVRK